MQTRTALPTGWLQLQPLCQTVAINSNKAFDTVPQHFFTKLHKNNENGYLQSSTVVSPMQSINSFQTRFVIPRHPLANRQSMTVLSDGDDHKPTSQQPNTIQVTTKMQH